MHEAAAAEDGRVSRERVLEILGRPVSARLNGFRKPIDRAVATLIEQGDFPDVSLGPLHIGYNGGVSARSFFVAMSDLSALRAAIGS